MLQHISFSSLKDSTECPYRFKLRAIDRVRVFPNTIHTIFGTVMHESIQAHLLSSAQDQKATAKRFHRLWRKFAGLYRKQLDFELVKQYLAAGHNIIKHVNEAFEGYAVIASEQEIYTPIADSGVNFKGFIDLLMSHGERTVIADLKTAKSTKSFRNYMTPVKRSQLSYYRTFFSQQFDMPEKDIDLCYIVLEKDPASSAPIQFVPAKFSEQKTEKTRQVLNETLDMVKRNEFPKNRNECYNPFTGIRCPFFETPYCT